MSNKQEEVGELQARKAQIESTLQLKRAQVEVDKLEIDAAATFWEELTSHQLDDGGRKAIKSELRRYGLDEILECMRISADNYLRIGSNGAISQDSIMKAFEYIGRISRTRRKLADKPYLSELWAIRDILRSRFCITEWMALDLLEKAYLSGYSTSELSEIVRDEEIKSWSSWRSFMESLIKSKHGGK